MVNAFLYCPRPGARAAGQQRSMRCCASVFDAVAFTLLQQHPVGTGHGHGKR